MTNSVTYDMSFLRYIVPLSQGIHRIVDIRFFDIVNLCRDTRRAGSS
jgi:hypothetical protein